MIEIVNFTPFDVKETEFRKIVQNILKAEKKENKSLSIVIVGRDRIRKLNRKYRGKNRITDVLSFESNFDFPELEDSKETNLLGEVVICPSVIKENAKHYNTCFERELFRVLIHGILHLLGYDHKNKEEERVMRKKEEEYLYHFYRKNVKSSRD